MKIVKILRSLFRIQTANGLVSINRQLSYEIPWLYHMRFEPMILPTNAPAVMSLGKKIEEGWSFIWRPTCCTMIAPDGKQIEMTVIQRVPYLLNPKSLDITAMPAINEAQIGPAIGEATSRKRTKGDKKIPLKVDDNPEACDTTKAESTVAPTDNIVSGLLPDCKFKAVFKV